MARFRALERSCVFRANCVLSGPNLLERPPSLSYNRNVKAISAEVPSATSSAYRAILLAGSVSGVLDITAAFVTAGMRGIRPTRVLQYIASGVLGPDAFNGGFPVASLGMGLHFLIAFGASAAYYAASRKLGFLTGQAIAWGLPYGIAVYLFMNLVVLPLSAVSKPRYTVASVVTGLFIHMLCIGLPISMSIRWVSK
jgi:hypothetical protein